MAFLIALAVPVVLALLIFYGVFRARRVKDVTDPDRLPLAGYDTGTRSPYRLPSAGRFPRPNVRGF